MKKVELLAPAGNIEKLKFALEYGADAVYLGYPELSLRTAAEKFSPEDIEEAFNYTKSKGKRLYIALNIFAYNENIKTAKEAIKKLKKIGVDGLIVADPGIIQLIKELWPEAKIHLSTQSNTTNLMSVKFWKNQGLSRVCLARELSLEDIKKICAKKLLEVEVFVHGAMCVSYSGRCYLSKYMINREGNLGDCAHSCRWKYSIVEEQRPGELLEVQQDEFGTYILNSKDLCLARHIPQLIDAGVNTFKIEGRMKTIHYISVVTSVYRQIIDSYYEKGSDFVFLDKWMDDLRSIGHRHYTEGFIHGSGNPETEYTKNSKRVRSHEFLGYIDEKTNETNGLFRYKIKVRNQIKAGDSIEFFARDGRTESQLPVTFYNSKNGEAAETANPNSEITISSIHDMPLLTLVRKKLKS